MKTKTVTCAVCGLPFKKKLYECKRTIRLGYRHCCSRKCSTRLSGSAPSQLVSCSNCSKPFLKSPSQIKKSKSGKHFCCKSCATIYNNKHKKYGIRRSKLESYIESIVTSSFPHLPYECNSKEIIGSELDFYFPTLSLAVEINGIYHYEPIHGKNKLTSIQNNDKSKLRACDEKNIDLIIISDLTSRLTPNEKDKFKTDIITLIKSKI